MIELPEPQPRPAGRDVQLPGLPSGGARCSFALRGEFSPVRFQIDTGLGSCSLGPQDNPTLSGTLLEYLRPGAQPVALGQDGGGYCISDPHLSGESAPLRVALHSFALSPHSRPFGISAAGDFLAHTHWEITSGRLELFLPGRGMRSIDLRGRSSAEHSGLGHIRCEEDGLHLARDLDLQFQLREPGWGMHVLLQVHGLVCGYMQYPGDWPARQRCA